MPMTDLILLVGSNPLPNYVVALHFKPDNIHLFYTSATKLVKNNLVDALVAHGGFAPQALHSHFLSDHAVARKLHSDFQVAGIPPGAHLNYTGGTKAMAVHLHAAWAQECGTAGGASYLDGDQPRLILDDGSIAELDEPALTLPAITELHGVDRVRSGYGPHSGVPADDDARAMAAAVARDRGLQCVLLKRVPECKKKPLDFSFAACGLPKDVRLSRTRVTTADGRALADVWSGFLRGEWLDHWVALLLRESGAFHEVVFNVEGFREGRQMQIDAIGLQGHRLFLVSCTTSSEPARCKTKAFEASIRAAQFGGGLARSAEVCLLDADPLANVRKDLALFWENRSETNIFGIPEMAAWIAGDLSPLKEWAKK